MKLTTIAFESKGKNYQLNFNELDGDIRQIEGFPNSTRIFEEFFANVKDTIDRHGKKVKDPKGKCLELLGDNIYLGLHYKKTAITDCLQVVIKDHDYYKHIGMTRARNSLGFDYKTQIPYEDTRKDKFLRALCGEMQPDGFFTMDKNESVLVNHNFKKE